jgi:hypothetical protein
MFAFLKSARSHTRSRSQPVRDAYTYAAISCPGTIRLLSLQPGRGDEELITKLKYVSLGNPGRHKALSYVWGDATMNQSILCNEKRLPITQSLTDALRAVRHPTATFTM